jgi:predicted GNAT family N-acyltransferase
MFIDKSRKGGVKMIAKKIATKDELETAFYIRKEVFVSEQGVSLADEFDQYDQLNNSCDHILVYYNGESVGTGRVRVVEGVGKLERICILKQYRKYGLGKVIIEALERIVEKRGVSSVKLHGQVQAQGFYNKLGYDASSDVFMEDGIPHVLMVKEFVHS